MRVKIFDETHEEDLEDKVNEFLADMKDEDIINFQYQVAIMYDNREQIYCYSCLIAYKDKP